IASKRLFARPRNGIDVCFVQPTVISWLLKPPPTTVAAMVSLMHTWSM
ncbi:hypothetical protein GCK32_022274, partial [Trichostrongylus colubriformis]